MKEFLSNKALGIQPSALVSLMEKSRKLTAEGKDVCVFAGGEPDFDTPAPITNAAIKALQNGDTHYVSSPGIPTLRQRIARKLREENNMDVDWATQLIVTPSGKYALNLALSAILNPGEDVMILEPAWVSYRQIIGFCGGNTIAVPLDYDDNYRITKEKLEAYVTPNTSVLFLNTPCNPTGRVLTEEEANVIADFVEEYKILVISDEIYEKIIYDGRKHISIGSFDRIKDYVITINGFSKNYAMTGWRLAYIAAHPDLIAGMTKIVQNAYTCAPSFIQTAAVEAFDCEEEVENMRLAYLERRDYIVDALSSMKGVTCKKPEGAFYILPRFEIEGKETSFDIAEYLLNEALVCAAPGDAFGQGADKCIRFSYATAMSEIQEAMRRLKELLG